MNFVGVACRRCSGAAGGSFLCGLGIAFALEFIPAECLETSSKAPPASVKAVSGLNAILQETDSYQRLRKLAPYADGVAAADLPAAVESLRTAHGAGRDDLMEALIGRWVVIDPDGALKAARGMGIDRVANSIIDDVYAGWATRDPSAAIKKVGELPAGFERSVAIWAIVSVIAEDDPAQAHELFESVRTFNLGEENRFIFSQWARKNLHEATMALLDSAQFSTPARQREAVEGAADYLFDRHVQMALWWQGQLPAGPVHDFALTRIAERWSRIDPSEALLWTDQAAENTVSGGAKKAIREQIIEQWTDQEPIEAVRYAATLPEGEERREILENGLATWTESDPEAAWKWTLTLPASEPTSELLLEIISKWAQNNPAQAAAKLSLVAEIQFAPSEIYYNRHSVLPERPPKEKAYGDVATSWAAIDRVEAEKWLSQLPAGPQRDAAVESYSEAIVEADPSAAVHWAESVTEVPGREKELRNLMFHWSRNDPVKASLALADVPLPEADKTLIRKAITQPR
jgi:hypothetical protein